jgi:sterol desaturase/sphingolipid hydroxylase (fatty acid hydroxylase superfamily)
MSDAASLGQRDRKGEWRPPALLQPPLVYVWPPRPVRVLRWAFGFPGFLLPWNALWAAVAALTWAFATPDMDTMRSFAPGWIAFLLVRNLVLMLLVFGALHLWLHVRKGQGMEFKYTSRWQATDNPSFLFRNQVLDNMVWTIGSGLPIWTAWEAVTLWMQANGHLPYVTWSAHPLYCALLMLFIPVWREAHFYAVHRLIHRPPLYRSVHSLHHKNVDPGPWSGLAMHPIEHLLYFSGVLLHWIVPSNGLHVVFHLQHLAFAPAPGHAGFEKVRLADGAELATGNYWHYLHHKYFEVNYGSDLVPIDQWVGTFHDGSEAAGQRMNARLKLRSEREGARRRRQREGSAAR